MSWIGELMYPVRRGLVTSQSRLRVWSSSGVVFANNVDNGYYFNYCATCFIVLTCLNDTMLILTYIYLPVAKKFT